MPQHWKNIFCWIFDILNIFCPSVAYNWLVMSLAKCGATDLLISAERSPMGAAINPSYTLLLLHHPLSSAENLCHMFVSHAFIYILSYFLLWPIWSWFLDSLFHWLHFHNSSSFIIFQMLYSDKSWISGFQYSFILLFSFKKSCFIVTHLMILISWFLFPLITFS